MIAAGDSLGVRYVVSAPPEEFRTGALFEVVDRSATVVPGQLLGENSVTPSQVAEVRAELALVPGLPTLVRPRELVLSPRSIPAAILDRPGIVTLRSRVSGLAEAQGKRPFAISLLRGIGAIAADLAVAHQSGAIHGAISSRVLASNPRADTETYLLSGFGISGFAVRAGAVAPGQEPTRRKDLIDLLGALHDLFLVSGVQPEGSASARWTLLRHSAMHGEHPALASGTALAASLNEIASLPDDADAPPPRRPTLAPGSRTTTTMTGRVPAAGATTTSRITQPPARRTTGEGLKNLRAPTERPAAPARPRFSMAVLGGGFGVIVLVAGLAAFKLWKTQQEVGGGNIRVTPHVIPHPHPPGGSVLTCPGESLEPLQGLRPETPFQEFDGACADGNGSPWLTLVARTRTTVIAALRHAQPGQLYGAAMTLGTGAVELGSALSTADATWVAWRNGVGVPMGLARVDGQGPSSIPIVLSGWDSVPLHGAALLAATARDVFVISNVEVEGNAHPVLFDIALAPLGGRPPVTTWYLGQGVVDSVIPGDTPTVLLHAVTSGHHALTALTLHLAAITAGHPTPEAATVRGSNPPDAAVDRSATITVDAEALASAPHGAGPVPAFLVTAGAARTTETCAKPGRCVDAGVVSLVSFQPGGEPVVRMLARPGWAEDLSATSDGGLRALLMLSTPSGAPASVYTEVTLASPTADVHRAAVHTMGSTRAEVLRCGAEPWMIFDAPGAQPAVAALPLGCLRPSR